MARQSYVHIYVADLRSHHGTTQFGLKGRFLFNSTLENRASEYAKVNQHIQVFRDLSPGSGAYFVSLYLQERPYSF